LPGAELRAVFLRIATYYPRSIPRLSIGGFREPTVERCPIRLHKLERG